MKKIFTVLLFITIPFFLLSLSSSAKPAFAQTCSTLGYECGVYVNPTTGFTVSCGTCSTAGTTCVNNKCVGQSCTTLNYECGVYVNPATGFTTQCGTCATGTTCVNNKCFALPSCSSQRGTCVDKPGPFGSGGSCNGNRTDAFSCTNSNQTCCVPYTCAEKGGDCGNSRDCAGTVNTAYTCSTTGETCCIQPTTVKCPTCNPGYTLVETTGGLKCQAPPRGSKFSDELSQTTCENLGSIALSCNGTGTAGGCKTPANIPECNILNGCNPDGTYKLGCTSAGCDTAIGPIAINSESFIRSLFRVLLSIVGGIAVLLIIISGFKLVTSQGNPERVQAAKEQLTAAIIGLLFAVFSLVFLETIGVDILGLPGVFGG